MSVLTWSPGEPDEAQTPVIRVKTADENVTSSTTAQTDDHLEGFILETDVRYSVELLLAFDASADGPGLKFGIQTDNTWNDDVYMMADGVDNARTIFSDTYSAASGGTVLLGGSGTMDDSLDPMLKLHAMVRCGSDSILDFIWAQNSSSATTLTLKAGSWMRVTPLQ